MERRSGRRTIWVTVRNRKCRPRLGDTLLLSIFSPVAHLVPVKADAIRSPTPSINYPKPPTSATWWTLLRAVNEHGSRVCAVCMCLLLFVNSAPTSLDELIVLWMVSLLMSSRIDVPYELEREREGPDTKHYFMVGGWTDGHWFPKK